MSDQNQPKVPPLTHDAFFRVVFGEPAHAEQLLRAVLPEALRDQFHWARLSRNIEQFIGQNKRKYYADLTFMCPFGADEKIVLVSFVLEHKSEPNPDISVQLMRYVLELREAQPKGKQALYPVIPIVVYHGEEPWHIPDSVYKGLLAPYQHDIPYHLLNLRELPEKEIFRLVGGLLGQALIVMKHAWETEQLLKDLEDIINAHNLSHDPDADPGNLFGSIIVYLWNRLKKVPDMIQETIDRTEERVSPEPGSMLEAYVDYFLEKRYGDQMRKEAKELAQDMAQDMAQDLAQGLAQGLAQDMAKDMAQGLAQDMAQDLAQGLAKDMAKGLAQNMAKTQVEQTLLDKAKKLLQSKQFSSVQVAEIYDLPLEKVTALEEPLH